MSHTSIQRLVSESEVEDGEAQQQRNAASAAVLARKPTCEEVARPAVGRFLLLLVFCLSAWVLVSIKQLTEPTPEIYFAVYVGALPIIIEWACLARTKGREWDFGWAPAVLAFVPGAMTVTTMMLVDTLDLTRAGHAGFNRGPVTLYGIDGLALSTSYAELVFHAIAFLLLASAFGAWWMSPGKMFQELRVYVFLAALAQALDAIAFIYSVLGTKASVNDTMYYLCVTFTLAPFLQFTCSPSPHVIYNQNRKKKNRKCVANAFSRIGLLVLFHELPLFIGRLLMILDPAGVFNKDYQRYIYAFITKNICMLIFFLSWLLSSSRKGCAEAQDNDETEKTPVVPLVLIPPPRVVEPKVEKSKPEARKATPVDQQQQQPPPPPPPPPQQQQQQPIEEEENDDNKPQKEQTPKRYPRFSKIGTYYMRNKVHAMRHSYI